VRGGLTLQKLTKTQLLHSVSFFNLGGLELCLEGLSPQKSPRGDGTAYIFRFSRIAFFCIVLSNVFTPTRKALEFKHASQ